MTQTEAILDYLNKHGSITTYESFVHLKCTRLASRVHDLRSMGYKIRGDYEEVNGKKIYTYRRVG